MPTFEVSEVFRRDIASLTSDQYARFQVAVHRFIEDLRAMAAGEQVGFRPRLRAILLMPSGQREHPSAGMSGQICPLPPANSTDALSGPQSAQTVMAHLEGV